MRGRLYLLLLALLATGLIAAGCGDDDDDDGDGGGTPAATETQDGGGGDEGGGDEGAAGGAASSEAVKQAVEACKQSVTGQPQLSADVKSDLEEICEKAASGDEEDVRNATRDVCIKIVEETVPEGPARDQSVDACEQATKAP